MKTYIYKFNQQNQIMENICLSSEELELKGEKTLKVVEALASETNFKILKLVSTESLDVSTIALRLGFSEAHISEKVSRLENLGLIKVSYKRGRRGIRKICELAFRRIIISIVS
jgi:predicted transcriptional regulator